MLNNYFNKTNFYIYSGVTASDVNDSYVDFVINSLNNMIVQKLSRLFLLTPNFTYKYYPKNSRGLILIDNWQDTGVVDNIVVTNGGTGYSLNPTVTIAGNSATAKANVTAGIITSFDITYPGQPKSFLTAPLITITDTTGVNATAIATISSLIIQRGTDNIVADLSLLTEGNDYRVIYDQDTLPNRTFPVVGIELYYLPLWYRQFLQVTGTYGYSSVIPPELSFDLEFYEALKQIILKAELDTETGGRGLMIGSAIDKVNVHFDHAKKLTVRDLINDLSWRLDAIVSEYQDNSPKYVPSLVG